MGRYDGEDFPESHYTERDLAASRSKASALQSWGRSWIKSDLWLLDLIASNTILDHKQRDTDGLKDLDVCGWPHRLSYGGFTVTEIARRKRGRTHTAIGLALQRLERRGLIEQQIRKVHVGSGDYYPKTPTDPPVTEWKATWMGEQLACEPNP